MALTKDEIFERSQARAKGSESQKRLTASHRERVRTRGYKQRTATSPSVVASQLRIDRQAADQEFRKSQAVSSQQARVESENRRITRQDATSRRRLYNSGVDNIIGGSGGTDSFGSTPTGQAVSSGGQSISGGIIRVLLVVVGLAVLYLFVSNNGKGGSTLVGKLGAILNAFTSNQSLFSSNATPTSGSGVVSELTPSGGTITNNPTRSIQQGSASSSILGKPRSQLADGPGPPAV